MIFVKVSTAVTVSFGPFLLNTDGVTLVTNLTGTGANQTENTTTGIRLSKNGGAFAARHATAGASNYDAYGNYLVPLDTTDTNTLGIMRMQFQDAAHFCPVWLDMMVVPAPMWNSLFGTGGSIPDAAAGAAGGLPVSTAGSLDLDEMNVDIEAIQASTANLPAMPAATGDAMTLTSGERNATADALLDRSNGVETGYTPRQSLRLMLAALAAKLSGAATATVTIRNVTDSKDRITASVDVSGNRTAVTLDGT